MNSFCGTWTSRAFQTLLVLIIISSAISAEKVLPPRILPPDLGYEYLGNYVGNLSVLQKEDMTLLSGDWDDCLGCERLLIDGYVIQLFSAMPAEDENEGISLFDGYKSYSDGFLTEDLFFTYEYDDTNRIIRKESKNYNYSAIYRFNEQGDIKNISYLSGEFEEFVYGPKNRFVKVVYSFPQDAVKIPPHISLLYNDPSKLIEDGNKLNYYMYVPSDLDSALTTEDMNRLGLGRYVIGVCGNLVWEPASGEECDDGNKDPDDGCDMCLAMGADSPHADDNSEKPAQIDYLDKNSEDRLEARPITNAEPRDTILLAAVILLVMIVAILLFNRFKKSN